MIRPIKTEHLAFRSSWQEQIDAMWELIKVGWSVVSAIYDRNKEMFFIKLSTEDWPEITLPCSKCGTRWPPDLFYFEPFPSSEFTCVRCRGAR